MTLMQFVTFLLVGIGLCFDTFAVAVSFGILKKEIQFRQASGIALVLVGAYLFLKNLDFAWLSWLNTNVILAALIAAAGVALLVVAIKRGK